MIRLKDLIESSLADKKKRLGGRYGGEPEKAIADPGNKEPAISATNEAAPVGKVQASLMKVLRGGGQHELSDLARDPEFRGVRFDKIQTAAGALKKKKLVNYDGVSTVSLVEKGKMNEKDTWGKDHSPPGQISAKRIQPNPVV